MQLVCTTNLKFMLFDVYLMQIFESNVKELEVFLDDTLAYSLG